MVRPAQRSRLSTQGVRAGSWHSNCSAMRLGVGLALAVAATAILSSCSEGEQGPGGDPGAGSKPIELASVLERCTQIDVNAELEGTRTTFELKSAKADTVIGLSCVFAGPDGLRVSFYQYADDADSRRGPLSEFATGRTAPIDGVGDDAYASVPQVYNDGVAPPSSMAEIQFDVQTSRWKGVAYGDPDEVDRLGELLASLARNVAEASERFGPLRQSDIEIAPESRRLLEVDRQALIKILDTPAPPDPEPSVSGDLETDEVSESLVWKFDDRSVSVKLLTETDTPQAYVDQFLESESSSGNPALFAFAATDGLGDGAVASTWTSDIPTRPFASFEYVFKREREVYVVTVSDSGASPVSESEAKSFVRGFFAGS